METPTAADVQTAKRVLQCLNDKIQNEAAAVPDAPRWDTIGDRTEARAIAQSERIERVAALITAHFGK